MNEKEAAKLLGYCAAFDNRKPSTAAAIAWSSALRDVPLDADAKAAIDAYYTTPPKDPDAKLWILPHHVRTLRSKIRSARLENFQYEPVAGESTAEYLARYRGQVQAIASGHVPAPAGRLALTGGPSKEFMQELEARGWQGNRAVPNPDDSDPQAEAVSTVRRAGPLGVVCPKCEAAIGRPCRRPALGDRHPLGKERSPHPERRLLAGGQPLPDPEAAAAEEARRRAISARYLAEHADEIHDAEIVEDAQ
jgi:hypothetical protein